MRVILAIMGPYPMEYAGGNTREEFRRMATATTMAEVDVYEIPDLVPTVGQTKAYNTEWGPKHRGLHAMRCNAAEKAREGKYDYLFVVENDVVLPASALDQLLARDKDHIVPRLEFPDFPIIRSMVYQPVPPKGQGGLWRIEWCGYPATLYRMGAFAGIEPMFVGGGEGLDYTWWHDAGIETWMDLDVEAVNLRLSGPHKIIVNVPGAYTNHMKKLPGGEMVVCDGWIKEGRDRDTDGIEIYHLECNKCVYKVDWKPPEGYRNESLRVSGILERAVDRAGVLSS